MNLDLKSGRFAKIQEPNTYYFLGIDPAPAQGRKSDDGALAVLKVRPKVPAGLASGIVTPTNNISDWLAEFVWCYRMRGKSIREWSGFIHLKHRHFGFAGICMDPQGGGQWINLELVKAKQMIMGIETDCVPIADMVSISADPSAQLILTMYRRSDPGIAQLWPHLAGDDNLSEAMHVVFQEAMTYMLASFPKPFSDRTREETEAWEEERKWALKDLDAARGQLIDIQVATLEDGTWAMTRNGAKSFSALGKKDLAYACIFAYVRFLIWLKMGELEFSGEGTEEGCYVMA